jgi:uncharacterized cupin superfamily protein
VASIEIRRFEEPDEHRAFEGKGAADVVNIYGKSVVRGVFEPGWKWSVNVKPIAGTDSCQFTHLSYILSGRIRVTLDDGTEGTAGPGDIVAIPPGHDAEVISDEACVMVDLADMGDSTYAKR